MPRCCAVIASCLCVLLAIASGIAKADPSPDDIIAANDATWGGVYTLDVTYDIRVTSGSSEDKALVDGVRWIRRGDTERLLLTDKNTQSSRDYFLQGSTGSLLEVPDGADLTSVSICDQHGIRGRRFRRVPGSLKKTLERVSFLDYFNFLDAPPLSLREFVSANQVRGVTGVRASDGSDCWSLRVEYRSKGESDARTGSYVDVVVDEGKGYLIKKLEFFDTGAATEVGGDEYVPVKYEWEVMEFAESSSGEFFPRRIAFRNFGKSDESNGSEAFVVEVDVTDVVVNGEISDESLAFSFPEDLIVDSREPGVRDGVIYVWGPEDAPKREFSSSDEADAFFKQQCGESQETDIGPRSSVPLRVWIFATGILIVFFGVLLRQRSSR